MRIYFLQHWFNLSDPNLPYGLRIGGSVLFDNEVPFIIAAGAGHLVQQPKGGVARISAYGRMPADGNTIHRCYLDADAGEESFLQAITGPDRQPITSSLIFSFLITGRCCWTRICCI